MKTLLKIASTIYCLGAIATIALAAGLIIHFNLFENILTN